MLTVNQQSIDALRMQVKGPIIGPQDAEYEQARRVYNAMIDRRPALIARALDDQDVAALVNFARENKIELAVRGGGHHGAGLGVWDDALVIDLSLMRRIDVDPRARTVWVQGGCTLGDIDQATHPYGLAVPTGINSTTGIGGLALGGGFGHLTRKYGLTIDNVLAVEMVLADGTRVKASEAQNRDLYWAVRGGGGNFGVVTRFQFRLHPAGTVIAGPTIWPLEKTSQVMHFYRQMMDQAPEDLNGILIMHTIPPAPPFPEHLHLQKVCGIVCCYTGPAKQADQVLDPIRSYESPAFVGVTSMPFPVLQAATDALYPPGLQWYWRSDFFDELSDAAVEQFAQLAPTLPTPHSRILLFPINGAAARVGSADTPFAYRHARFSQVIVGVDPDPLQAERISSWAAQTWEALHPHSSGGAYVNFMMSEGEARIRASYGANYARLSQIKARYDPDNLFHLNQNIPPAR